MESGSLLPTYKIKRTHIMKENIFYTSLFILTLTACASSGPQAGPGTQTLSTQAQLAIGTLRLEDTEYPITTEQAKELLPMWYVLQDLNDSDTAAQEEIDGLTNQIQEVLTSDQTEAITALNLSREDMFAAMQSGNSLSAGSSPSQGNPAQGPGGGGNFQPGGDFPRPEGGNFPGGNVPGGIPSGGTIPSGSEDPSARQAMSNSVPTALFDSVIEFLQKKIEG
jgi:hypothetical protein